MSEKPVLLAAALGWTIAVYFTIAGAILRHDPPSPAEASIGNGFWVLAGALGIIAFAMTAVYGEIRTPRPGIEPPPSRDDFEDV
jgi:hypothetical protein